MLDDLLSQLGMDGSVLGSLYGDADFTMMNLLLSMAVALALGWLISFVYMRTHKAKTPPQSFVLTLFILPMIVTIIILLIGNSVARAFSLAGAFQIIRFRSTPADSKDISYVLFCMAVGLCCGMGFLAYGVIAAVILCAVMVVLGALHFGEARMPRQLLKITVPEDLDYQDAFDDVFAQYTSSYTRERVRTVAMGSLYELQYALTAKPGIDEKAFIDDLRVRNGNLNVTLVLDAPSTEL